MKLNEREADAARAAQSVRLTTGKQALVLQLKPELRKRDVVTFEGSGIRIPAKDTFKQARSAVAALFGKALSIIQLGLEEPNPEPEPMKSRRQVSTNVNVNRRSNDNGTSLHSRIRNPQHFLAPYAS